MKGAILWPPLTVFVGDILRRCFQFRWSKRGGLRGLGVDVCNCMDTMCHDKVLRSLKLSQGFPTSERALEEMSISERNTVIQFAADYLAEQRDPTVKV